MTSAPAARLAGMTRSALGAHLGFGHIAVSEIKAPNMLVILMNKVDG